MTQYFSLPWALVLAPVLVAGLVWLLAWAVRTRKERMRRLGEPGTVSRLAPVARKARLRAILLSSAAACAAVAFAGPQWGTERMVVRSSGADVVLAMDASLSMLARDVNPDRLTRMKQVAKQLISASDGDRFGIIAFAGRSYILTPMTVDRSALDLFLDNLDPDVVGQGGSSLARTIRQGTELLLLTKGGGDRALVVMTDGEAFDEQEDVLAEARRARESGVALVFVGFGSEEGTTIPVPTSRGTELKRDENGQIVVTRADPELLSAAAEAGDGTYIGISATDKAARIRQALAQLRRQQRLSDAGRAREQRYQLFLIPALLLLFADTILAERRRRQSGHPAATTAVAAAALLALLVFPRVARAAPGDAERLYREGRYAEAAALWRRAIAEGDTSARTAYNLGTALLKANRPDDAIEPLEHATRAADAEVRFRALFNLGLLYLERARAAEKDSVGSEGAAQAYAAAKDLYKRALRLRSSDMDAKWNYELSNKRERESGGGGGGSGGGGGAQQQQQRQSQSPQPQPSPAGGIDPRQAERLLNSAAREERDVQGRRQQQARSQRPPLGKDW